MNLISEDYLRQNAELHQTRPGYGRSGHYWLGRVLEIVETADYRSVLDYGCGKGTLAPYLEIHGLVCRSYDPAVEAFAAPPRPMDLVVCLDVLEHIEPERLDAVLRHISEHAIAEVFLVVATRPAGKELPDGRNAHLIVEPYEWWAERLARYFRPFEVRQREGHDFEMRAQPK